MPYGEAGDTDSCADLRRRHVPPAVNDRDRWRRRNPRSHPRPAEHIVGRFRVVESLPHQSNSRGDDRVLDMVDVSTRPAGDPARSGGLRTEELVDAHSAVAPVAQFRTGTLLLTVSGPRGWMSSFVAGR